MSHSTRQTLMHLGPVIALCVLNNACSGTEDASRTHVTPKNSQSSISNNANGDYLPHEWSWAMDATASIGDFADAAWSNQNNANTFALNEPNLVVSNELADVVEFIPPNSDHKAVGQAGTTLDRASSQAADGTRTLTGAGLSGANYPGCTPKASVDFLDRMFAHRRRILPRDCKVLETSTPLFSWAEPPDRNSRTPWNFTLRSSTGTPVFSKSASIHRLSLAPTVLAPGNYEWRVGYTNINGTTVASDWRKFSVLAGTRADSIPDGLTIATRVATKNRPRMLATGSNFSQIAALAKSSSENNLVLNSLLAQAKYASEISIPAGPTFQARTTFTNDLAYTQYLLQWMHVANTERTRIESIAVAAGLTNDAALRDAAIKRLNALAAWTPEGATSDILNDQANRNIYLALAEGLDLLWDSLTPLERSTITRALRSRVLAAIANIKLLDTEPYDSHRISNVRWLTQTLLLAAGLPDFPEANALLANQWDLSRFTLNAWGDDDGSFGNGIAYGWYSFLSITPFVAAVRAIADVDLTQVPYVSRGGEQLIAFTAPNKVASSALGDETETNQLYTYYSPDFYRLHALLTKNPTDEWYWRQRSASVVSPNNLQPWHLLLLPYYPSRTAPAAPSTNSWFFADSGIAAMHLDASKSNRTSVFFRSSRFGAYNHSHADQNSFVFFSSGEPLLINAGYYPYYGSPHHVSVTRATRYKNALTFDGGIGQAEANATTTRPTAPLHSMDNSGALINGFDDGEVAVVTGDATKAYRGYISSSATWSSLLTNAVRSIAYIRSAGHILIYDWATSASSRRWELNFHSPTSFTTIGSTVKTMNGSSSACFDTYGPPLTYSQTSNWDVAPERAMPSQSHIRLTVSSPSNEFVNLTIIRDGCQNSIPSAVNIKGTIITATVDGKVYVFDKKTVTLPAATR